MAVLFGIGTVFVAELNDIDAGLLQVKLLKFVSILLRCRRCNEAFCKH